MVVGLSISVVANLAKTNRSGNFGKNSLSTGLHDDAAIFEIDRG